LNAKAPDCNVVDNPSSPQAMPAAYYLKLAARVRRLAEETTTPAIKGRLQATALEYERLAKRVDSGLPPIES